VSEVQLVTLVGFAFELLGGVLIAVDLHQTRRAMEAHLYRERVIRLPVVRSAARVFDPTEDLAPEIAALRAELADAINDLDAARAEGDNALELLVRGTTVAGFRVRRVGLVVLFFGVTFSALGNFLSAA
jgi:hypothetical protein